MKSIIITTMLLTGTSLNASSKFENFIKQELENIVTGNENAPADKAGDTFHGPTSLTQKKMKKLTIYGPADLDHVEVSGKLDVAGPLEGDHLKVAELKVAGPVKLKKSKMGSLNVQGHAELKGSEVSGLSTIYGPLKAKETKFYKGITAYTNRIKLEDSEVESITVITQKGKDDKGLSFNLGKNMKITLGEEDEKNTEVPVVYLKEGSKVRGNVEFKGKAGQVVVKEGSKVQGKIINGKLVRE